MPGRIMRSAIPWTAPKSTSFASLNASSRLVFLPITSRSFSLGTVINERQVAQAPEPRSAIARRLTLKTKGRVTTAQEQRCRAQPRQRLAHHPCPRHPYRQQQTPCQHPGVTRRCDHDLPVPQTPISGFHSRPSLNRVPTADSSRIDIGKCLRVRISTNEIHTLDVVPTRGGQRYATTTNTMTLITAFCGALSTSSNIVFLPV